MKLSTNTYQRFLCITASACILGIVGCSDLPRTASSNFFGQQTGGSGALQYSKGSTPMDASSAWAAGDTGKYTSHGVLDVEAYHQSLDSVVGLSPTAYQALYDPHPLPRGGGASSSAGSH
jgi:hypothetical protein